MRHRNRKDRHAKNMRHRKAIGKRRRKLAGEPEPGELEPLEVLEVGEPKVSLFKKGMGAVRNVFRRRHQSR